MIEIITTVESFEQAKELIEAGTDTLYFGEELFGLRLPASFSREEQRQLVELAHQYGKQANIAVNGIIHPEKMKKVPEYLKFLKEIGVDKITVGDTGIIYTMKKYPELSIPYIFDAETLVSINRNGRFYKIIIILRSKRSEQTVTEGSFFLNLKKKKHIIPFMKIHMVHIFLQAMI